MGVVKWRSDNYCVKVNDGNQLNSTDVRWRAALLNINCFQLKAFSILDVTKGLLELSSPTSLTIFSFDPWHPPLICHPLDSLSLWNAWRWPPVGPVRQSRGGLGKSVKVHRLCPLALIGWRMQASLSRFGDVTSRTSSLRNKAASPAQNSDFQVKKKKSNGKSVGRAAAGNVLFQLWRSEMIRLEMRRQTEGHVESVYCESVYCESAGELANKETTAAGFILRSQCHYFCSRALLCSSSGNVILSFLCLSLTLF